MGDNGQVINIRESVMKHIFRHWQRPGIVLGSLLKKGIIAVLVLLVVFLAGRIYESQRGPALHRWHTWSGNEMSAEEIDQATFAQYRAREQTIFADLQREVTDKLPEEDKTPVNRFYRYSRVWPGQFHQDWNRSFVLVPQGKPRGSVVLLHGLTDSPYSVRDLAQRWQQRGYVAVVPRLPGHGTAPGALTAVDWETWLATTRLAVREATRLAGEDVPLHLVGYSNGGALALKYALDSLEDSHLRQPQQIILLSPMIGVTAFARFAGLAGLPSIFPAFARAAWLNVAPEFNPFKYNSFPVKAARQSWLLSQALQQQIIRAARQDELKALPPVLTFQSVMDSTVSTRAVVESLYRYLPDNGSELVVFDINQAADLRVLFRPALYAAVNTLLPPAPRAYTTTVVTNATAHTLQTVARTTLAQEQNEHRYPLHLAWPADMYSLSHVAVPFPLSDSLYGREPDEKNRYGISLGTISLRGETGTLSVGLETLMRVTSNPFFPWMLARVDEHITCGEQAAVAACLKAQARAEALKQDQVQNGAQQDPDDRRRNHEAKQTDKP
ncbi:Thermostable monoacylglycerol lipase [Klebsiella quasivariicola]|uniref:Membrane protein n=2 Tax=Klebsiella/Raoultella group TaxID=2890311 RepID=A0A8B4U1G2_9ENTR|nr:membrane protein [Klebsiella quasivariicola]SXE01813.1 membrane protein [Klebsiella quasivariicola]VAN56522.1 putative lysophospholipase [Klebsiella quasivariicola]VGP42081.1 Thermostable monoacylglycerol lipase [Klebsiella quasivariicola]VGP94645.1 Thermostable monoacylglycerol lipase [Klebsiella quasivariicola]